MTDESENISLFDMDGTLCNYDFALIKDLKKLKAPCESPISLPITKKSPPYLQHRANLIRASEDWWAEIPKFKLGWDVLQVAKDLEFRIMILTQGPKKNSAAWAGKKRWIDSNLGEDTDVTITRDKGLVYGRILVDDFPGYIQRWLKWRKRGLVIMPASNSNRSYKHPQVIRYDGKNLEDVRIAMKKANYAYEN